MIFLFSTARSYHDMAALILFFIYFDSFSFDILFIFPFMFTMIASSKVIYVNLFKNVADQKKFFPWLLRPRLSNALLIFAVPYSALIHFDYYFYGYLTMAVGIIVCLIGEYLVKSNNDGSQGV